MSLRAKTLRSGLQWAAVLLVGAALTGCATSDYMTMFPSGAVGKEERNLIVVSALLMLFVFIPVTALTLWFAWRYRAQNSNARYEPRWDHSRMLEVFLWGGPIVIIAILGVLTWLSTHALDPYDNLKSENPELEVNAIAMDWKWLFIYPKYNVATVDEMAIPIDTPVEVNLTSDTVMTSFMIPALGSQIFAMSGMRTKLHVLSKKAGSYMGKNYQYNGDGFSHMTFATVAMPEPDFEQWVEKARAKGARLDEKRFARLTQPSEPEQVTYFSPVKDDLFYYVIGLYNNGQPRNNDVKLVKTAER